eukprot:10677989-Ditylum_brightwellii.AAC.1
MMRSMPMKRRAKKKKDGLQKDDREHEVQGEKNNETTKCSTLSSSKGQGGQDAPTTGPTNKGTTQQKGRLGTKVGWLNTRNKKSSPQTKRYKKQRSNQQKENQDE